MTKATTQSKKQTNTNGSKITKPVSKNGKLPSAETLLGSHTADEISEMFTTKQLAQIFTGNQLMVLASQINSSSQTRKRKRIA